MVQRAHQFVLPRKTYDNYDCNYNENKDSADSTADNQSRLGLPIKFNIITFNVVVVVLSIYFFCFIIRRLLVVCELSDCFSLLIFPDLKLRIIHCIYFCGISAKFVKKTIYLAWGLHAFAVFSDWRNFTNFTYITGFFSTEELSFDRAFVRFEFGHGGEFLNQWWLKSGNQISFPIYSVISERPYPNFPRKELTHFVMPNAESPNQSLYK